MICFTEYARYSPGKYVSGCTGNTAAKGNDFVYVCTAANAELPLFESKEKFILRSVSSPDISSKSSLATESDEDDARNAGTRGDIDIGWLHRMIR